MNSSFRRSSNPGFTLIALLVIIVVLAFLAALVPPALAAAKRKAQRINCANNLKQCGLSFRLWEGGHGDKYPMDVPMANGGTREFDTGADMYRHFQVMSNDLSTPKILICPADTRIAAINFARLKNQNVSYFVRLDAEETDPQMLLDGDRNIIGPNKPEKGILKLVPGEAVSWTAKMHVNQGNVGLSDGSVQQLSNSGLRQALQNSGDATNTWHISLPE